MSDNKSFQIRHALISRQEIAQIVKIHRSELSGGFLSSLGDTGLRLLFEHAVDCHTAVLLVVQNGTSNNLDGFLLGTVDTSAFYRSFLRRKGLKASFLLMPRLLSIRRIFRVMETLFYPRRQAVRQLPSAELMDIAISQELQGCGMGKKLFMAFCSELVKLGISEFRITTGEKLNQAHQFYKKLGARRVEDIEVHRGSKTFVYIYNLGGKIKSYNNYS